MNVLALILVIVLVVLIVAAMLGVKIVRQFESGVLFRLGRV
ncbi:MAG: slipin family protein, partial [Flavobacterium sp.]|nr:slipin family protein [Aeromicrobium sp.]